MESWPGRPARILFCAPGGCNIGRSSRSQSLPVALSQTSRSQNKTMEQKLTKGTNPCCLALTWHPGKAPSLPLLPSVQINPVPRPVARFTHNFAPTSAAWSSQSHSVALSRTSVFSGRGAGKAAAGYAKGHFSRFSALDPTRPMRYLFFYASNSAASYPGRRRRRRRRIRRGDLSLLTQISTGTHGWKRPWVFFSASVRQPKMI